LERESIKWIEEDGKPGTISAERDRSELTDVCKG